MDLNKTQELVATLLQRIEMLEKRVLELENKTQTEAKPIVITNEDELWNQIKLKHNIRKTQFTQSKIKKFFNSIKQLQDLLEKGRNHHSYKDILGNREFQRGSPEDLATNKKSSPKEPVRVEPKKEEKLPEPIEVKPIEVKPIEVKKSSPKEPVRVEPKKEEKLPEPEEEEIEPKQYAEQMLTKLNTILDKKVISWFDFKDQQEKKSLVPIPEEGIKKQYQMLTQKYREKILADYKDFFTSMYDADNNFDFTKHNELYKKILVKLTNHNSDLTITMKNQIAPECKIKMLTDEVKTITTLAEKKYWFVLYDCLFVYNINYKQKYQDLFNQVERLRLE